MIDFFPSRPVFVDLFGWEIHWYGLLYFAAFIVAWFLLPRLQRLRDLHYTADDWSGLLSWAVVGVIVGGRLGFVFFYEPAYFLAHPLEIIAVWRGGMASHGGFIGVTVALLIALRHKPSSDWLKIADIVVVPAAIGLSFGRIGNFINQEVYGTVTSLPWGISVPGEEELRHPAQMYAVLKDLFIALICFLYLYRRPYRPGRALALFLMLYGVLRFLVEFVREQPQGYLVIWGDILLSRGQLLTVPLFLAGVLLWWWTGRMRRKEGTVPSGSLEMSADGEE